jgi:hypothetical protein
VLLKGMRWALLLACYVVVVRCCRLFRLALPMESFWSPQNLIRFRPYYVAPRTGFYTQIPPKRGQ